MPTPVIAIFDVGKTNKKVFLFDEQYQIVWETSTSMDEITDEDGDPCEDLHALMAWLNQALGEIMALPQFDIKAINFSGYGASLVYIDEQGNPIGPLSNYLKPYPANLRQQFYTDYGPEGSISVQTASPALDSLNSGLQLYRLKHEYPERFAQLKYALHLPQFLSFLISRRAVADLTSVGCHTLLWDFTQQQYHHWVIAEQLDRYQAPLVPSDSAQPVQIGQRSVPVGVGLHDSSAALIPYLASFEEGSDYRPFVLISTGTWCVSMNPFNHQPLTAEELQYDCLCYMHYKGQPVKASRLFAGYEHESQVKRLATHFNVPVDHYKQVTYQADLIRQLQEADTGIDPAPEHEGGMVAPKLLPSLAETRFRQRDLTSFATYDEAYHQLMLDLVAQQLVSTALVLPTGQTAGEYPLKNLYVDGGFGKNPIYMHLLAAAFPDVAVYAASVPQASSLGAALAIHPYWNSQPVRAGLVSLRRYESK
ncbi:FGGY-family carbohydrate kinase [Rudanella lutea]|uniref:FGGY-family carbohydrate kinase n=1 Tax=Rudanella lutea TaxID=451374 RepID=UPI00035CF8A6|nr:FGGY family carbohydrate kinase [Rudanella lutea]